MAIEAIRPDQFRVEIPDIHKSSRKAQDAIIAGYTYSITNESDASLGLFKSIDVKLHSFPPRNFLFDLTADYQDHEDQYWNPLEIGVLMQSIEKKFPKLQYVQTQLGYQSLVVTDDDLHITYVLRLGWSNPITKFLWQKTVIERSLNKISLMEKSLTEDETLDPETIEMKEELLSDLEELEHGEPLSENRVATCTMVNPHSDYEDILNYNQGDDTNSIEFEGKKDTEEILRGWAEGIGYIINAVASAKRKTQSGVLVIA